MMAQRQAQQRTHHSMSKELNLQREGKAAPPAKQRGGGKASDHQAASPSVFPVGSAGIRATDFQPEARRVTETRPQAYAASVITSLQQRTCQPRAKARSPSSQHQKARRKAGPPLLSLSHPSVHDCLSTRPTMLQTGPHWSL